MFVHKTRGYVASDVVRHDFGSVSFVWTDPKAKKGEAREGRTTVSADYFNKNYVEGINNV
jgi:hypothetical protein